MFFFVVVVIPKCVANSKHSVIKIQKYVSYSSDNLARRKRIHKLSVNIISRTLSGEITPKRKIKR